MCLNSWAAVLKLSIFSWPMSGSCRACSYISSLCVHAPISAETYISRITIVGGTCHEHKLGLTLLR